MALLESSEAHRPSFALTRSPAVKQLSLSADEKLRFFQGLALFKDLLDKPYETRPGAKGPVKVSVGDALGEHAEFWEVPADTSVFQEGSFGEHLFFILRGQAGMSTNYSADIDRTVALPVDDLPEGSFFGEHSVLSMNAHLASVVTKTPALLMLIPQFIVQELVSTTESFRAAIMERYVFRVIRTLVRRVPVLRSASEKEFENVLRAASTRTFEVGATIFEQGQPSDDVFVISTGFVKIAQREADGETRVLSYLVEGDCFGDVGVLNGAPRSATATALGRVEALVLAGKAFREIVMSNPAAAAEAGAVDQVRRLDADMVANVTFVGRRMELRAEVMPNLDVIVINEDTCVRCDNCVKACAAAHEDGFSRLIRKGVHFEELMIPTACRFCQDPSCLLCKSGGIKRDKDGDIYFTESCIGCSGCAQRCPYGNITMVDTDEIDRPAVPSLIDVVLRRDGRRRADVPEATDKRPKLKRIPVKCDLDKGHLFPACVSNCPTGAIQRLRADELDRIISARE